MIPCFSLYSSNQASVFATANSYEILTFWRYLNYFYQQHMPKIGIPARVKVVVQYVWVVLAAPILTFHVGSYTADFGLQSTEKIAKWRCQQFSLFWLYIRSIGQSSLDIPIYNINRRRIFSGFSFSFFLWYEHRSLHSSMISLLNKS